MAFDYQTWLGKAQEQLEVLCEKRAELDREIADLQRGIEGFTPLVKKYPPWDRVMSVGITEAVKQLFMEEPGRCYGATDIRDGLIAKKVRLTQRNPLATIHQILSRLEDRGTIRPLNSDGRRLYYYRIPEEPPRVQSDIKEKGAVVSKPLARSKPRPNAAKSGKKSSKRSDGRIGS